MQPKTKNTTTTPPPPPHGCNATTKNTAKIHGKCMGDFCLKQCNDKARTGLLTFSRWLSRWKSIFVVTLAPKFWSTKIVTSFLYFHWTNNQISFNEAWKRNDAYSLDYFLFETIEPWRQEKKNGFRKKVYLCKKKGVKKGGFSPTNLLQPVCCVPSIYSQIRQSVFAFCSPALCCWTTNRKSQKQQIIFLKWADTFFGSEKWLFWPWCSKLCF